MKIILKEDIHGLGYKDDVVEVKDGYGRNFLIPNGKAVIANNSSLRQLEESRRQRAHKLAVLRADADAQAALLAEVALTIAAKTSASGTLFGSVNNIQVAEALRALGHTIDPKIIELREPVKEVGKYTAKINLHRDVVVEIPLEVVAEA